MIATPWSLEIENGQKFGMLTVLKEVDQFIQPSGQKQRGFLCQCECGTKKKIRLSHLRHNRIKSCGCIHGDRHGMTHSKLYNSWRAMKMRCNWKGYSESRLYSKRGISVCEKWDHSFNAFRDWSLKNGYKPGLTIDRKENSEGYNPENCRWVTQLENNCNRRNTVMVSYKGQLVSLSLLLHNLGKHDNATTILGRIRRGWDHGKAIEIPIRIGNYGKK